MKDFLYAIIHWIAKIHGLILSWNDSIETTFTDKELHFLVIGICGLALFLFVHLLFKWLATWSLQAISWVYTFTMLIVISFAIEIGQHTTKTGVMDFADILYGLWGFMLFFTIYQVARFVIIQVGRFFRKQYKAGDKRPAKRGEGD